MPPQLSRPVISVDEYLETGETTIPERDTSLPPSVLPLSSTVSSPAIRPLEFGDGSQIAPRWTKRRIHKWKSPLLMSIFFILGVAVSLAHCVFYPKLSGKIVGDSSQQEEKIRFGTACAFLAQICLGASVWTVYTQWLWRTVKHEELTMPAWNAAFSADTSVLSLLNLEMLRKLRVGSAMAIFAWSLLLPPFFTPATLFIYESTAINEVITAMPYPSISDGTKATRFSYSPPFRQGTTQSRIDQNSSFSGPRTIMGLIATATSSLGQILPIDLPYNNSEFSVQFFAPIVRCEEANSSVAEQIDMFREQELTNWGSARENDSAYFGFVPTYDDSGHLKAIWHPRQQTPSIPLNELWMTFLRPEISQNGSRIKPRHYQTCQPYNASYQLNVSQYHGVQEVKGNYAIGDVVPFPEDHADTHSNMTRHAFSAFMWVLCDQLVGKLAWVVDSNGTSPSNPRSAHQFGVIDSPIQRTSLLGSRDLDAFFEMDEEMSLYNDQNITHAQDLSDQRLRDKALAKNRTLAVLIEELSFNTTVSLMHNRLLTNSRNTTVRLTTDVNRYSYKAYGLFIPYALANLFTFLCVIIGTYSYIHDSVLPDKKIQEIIYAASPDHARRKSTIVATDIEDGTAIFRFAATNV